MKPDVNQCSKRQGGFTLIEVMIAVTIFVALATVLSNTTSQSAETFFRLQEKTLASFVAENYMAQLRLDGQPAVGQRNDNVDMAGREWDINIAVTPVPNAFFSEARQVTIRVSDPDDNDANIATLSTILGAR